MKKTNPVKKNVQNQQETSPSTQENKPSGKKQDGVKESGSDKFKPKITLTSHQEPTYYIGGNNGNALIEEVMDDLGWRKLKDKSDEGYTMKWCELKNTINYNTFKEGEQLVNHIPNCNLLTNKLGLLNSLQEYDRVCATVKKRTPRLDFIPETFRLDDPREREIWKDTWKEDEVWICKPTGRNQGKGIFLVKNREDFDNLCQEADEKSTQNQQGKMQKTMNRVIQRYLHNPLLVHNRKFDIRAYMLVASTSPYMILYHPGYLRLSIYEYENKYDNIAIHLTNQFIQKKDPKYKDMKEDTVWDMDKFNTYVNDNLAKDKGLEKDWVHNILPARMKHIMNYCFTAVKHKFHCKIGYFELYGFDFFIDEDMKVWLIEVNVNPTLATNCESLKAVIPPIVKESLYLGIECFDKNRKNRPLMPMQSLDKFEIIHNASSSRPAKSGRNVSPTRGQQPDDSGTNHRTQASSPVRRARSLSPSKDGMTQYNGDNRRAFLSLRPGMKPSPTNPVLASHQRQSFGASIATHSTNRSPVQQQSNNHPNKGSMLSSQLPSRNAPPASQSTARHPAPLQKSPYVLHKIGQPGVSAQVRMFNFDKSQQAQAQNKSNAKTNAASAPERAPDKGASLNTNSNNAKIDQNSQRQSKSPKSSAEKGSKAADTSTEQSKDKASSSTDTSQQDSKESKLSPKGTPRASTEPKASPKGTQSPTPKTEPAASNTKTGSPKETTSSQKGPSLKLISVQTSKSSQGPAQKRDATASNNSKSPYVKNPGFSKPTATTTAATTGKVTALEKPMIRPMNSSSNNNHLLSVKIIRESRSHKLPQTGVSLKMTHGKDASKSGSTTDNRGS